MNRYLILLMLVATAASAQNTPPQVTHVWAQQRQNTQLVDVNYSVSDVDNDELTVSLILLDGNGVVILLCASMTGDVGAGVQPGANKYITWDAGVDLPGQYGSDYAVRVVANDGYSPPMLDGFVSVPSGVFMMGSPTDEPGRATNETLHQVTLTHGFFCQATEVTNQQYTELAQWAFDHGFVTATNTSLNDNLDGSTQDLFDLDSPYCDIDFSAGVFTCGSPSRPVKEVSWFGSVAYCDWLSLQQGLPRAYNHGTWQCNGGNPYTAAGYRLPSEAEWEYACRAGSVTAFANGPITQTDCSLLDPFLDVIGWYCGNSGWLPNPVAQKISNAWGLYDMHGNVWEWCSDWYEMYSGDVTDPLGPETGVYRVYRGGPWSGRAKYCRSAFRSYEDPYYLYPSSSTGFRPVISSD